MATRLLEEVAKVLSSAVDEFEAVADLNLLRRCHYLLARTCHELGDQAGRDRHAGRFRRISEFLGGQSRTTWRDLGLPRKREGPGAGSGTDVLLERAVASAATAGGGSHGAAAGGPRA